MCHQVLEAATGDFYLSRSAATRDAVSMVRPLHVFSGYFIPIQYQMLISAFTILINAQAVVNSYNKLPSNRLYIIIQ